jgi:hypothetical protein
MKEFKIKKKKLGNIEIFYNKKKDLEAIYQEFFVKSNLGSF